MKIIYLSIAMACCLAGQGQTEFSVYFGFNKYGLGKDSRSRLDSFLKAGDYTTFILNLNGHCDSIGGDRYNDKLSSQRIASVKKYLLAKGIHQSNIGIVKAYGETEPLYENTTPGGRQLNRRVAISITKGIKNEDNRTLTETITDSATKAGTSIVLKNINFYGGSPFLLPESFSTLDELLEVMKRHTELVIEIQGHICCVPYDRDSEYGPTGTGLSEERARAVWAELVGNGIEPTRVSYKGYGHSQPIYPYPERSEEERTQNRRVEIKIISK
jgi:outer membrane protein OmpA-like peptidoglycan-associated protein